MSLINRLQELESQASIKSCKVASLLETLDEQTKSVLERVLQSKVPHSSIATELRDSGYEIGRTTIGLHRTGRCACGGKK